MNVAHNNLRYWFKQQMLLNAAKDVASALGALINATKNASGKPNNDPATEVLKTTGKVPLF